MNSKFDKFKRTPYKRKQEFKINENDFPDLTLNQSKNMNKETYLENSFASAILTDIKVETKIEDKLKPGWISIEYDKQTKIKKYSYGDKTESMIQRESILEDFDYRIEKMIDQLTENREKYIQYYENLYEDDSYKEKYFYNTNIDIDEDVF